MRRTSDHVRESRAPTSTTEPAEVFPWVSSRVGDAAAAAAAFFFAASPGAVEIEEGEEEGAEAPLPLPAYLEKHSSRRSGTNLFSLNCFWDKRAESKFFCSFFFESFFASRPLKRQKKQSSNSTPCLPSVSYLRSLE